MDSIFGSFSGFFPLQKYLMVARTWEDRVLTFVPRRTRKAIGFETDLSLVVLDSRLIGLWELRGQRVLLCVFGWSPLPLALPLIPAYSRLFNYPCIKFHPILFNRSGVFGDLTNVHSYTQVLPNHSLLWHIMVAKKDKNIFYTFFKIKLFLLNLKYKMPYLQAT